jgi:uncharacterized protein (TIGR02646 family)
MRGLIRLSEPNILRNKKVEWLQKLIISGKTRPDSTKYGNPQIRLQLNTISNYKCFYCESLLKEVPSEIDHFIEVTCDINKSYDWTNLYLACDNCNKKIPHNEIPVQISLDPFVDNDEEISNHIIFDDEIIRIKDNSEKGSKTIQKYRLNTKQLDYKRAIQLKNFYKVIEEIRKKQIIEGGRDLSNNEREVIASYSNSDKPYSLMFRNLLEKNNFL